MRTQTKYVLIVGLIMSLFLAACDKSKKKSQTNSDSMANILNAKDFYDKIELELERAYQEAGKPEPDFESLEKVKDIAMENLNEDMSKFPSGGSYSLSVMSDKIFIYASIESEYKEGDWKP